MFDQLFGATEGSALVINKAVKSIVNSAVKLRAIAQNYTLEIGALPADALALAYTEAVALQINVKVLADMGHDSIIKSILRSEVDTVNFVTKVINNLNGLIVTSGFDQVFKSAFETEQSRFALLDQPTDPYSQQGEAASVDEATTEGGFQSFSPDAEMTAKLGETQAQAA